MYVYVYVLVTACVCGCGNKTRNFVPTRRLSRLPARFMKELSWCTSFFSHSSADKCFGKCWRNDLNNQRCRYVEPKLIYSELQIMIKCPIKIFKPDFQFNAAKLYKEIFIFHYFYKFGLKTTVANIFFYYKKLDCSNCRIKTRLYQITRMKHIPLSYNFFGS